MNRRKLLTLLGGGIGLCGGGYLGWRWYTSPTTPAGMDVETLHVVNDVLADDASQDGGLIEAREEYYTIIEDADTADAKLEDTDPVSGFISNTEFNSSYIVIAQNGMQSVGELVLEAIERTESGIKIEISVDYPSSDIPDDLAPHSLLIRISDSKGDIPKTITGDIEGYT